VEKDSVPKGGAGAAAPGMLGMVSTETNAFWLPTRVDWSALALRGKSEEVVWPPRRMRYKELPPMASKPTD